MEHLASIISEGRVSIVRILLLFFFALPVWAACTPQGSGPLPSATATQVSAPAATPTGRPTTVLAPASPTAISTNTPQPATPARATATPTPEMTALAPSSAKTPVLNTEVLVKGLDTPWALDFAPDGRIFITERAGRIRVVKDGQLQSEPWMTLDVAEVGESGLMGLALDPQFAQNHFVYVAYTYRAANGQLQNRLVRLRDDPATGKGVMDRVLLDGIAGSNNHDGGRVKFGPDGKLYLTMGDAQNTALAQDRSSPNGKILRLNPDGTIPNDNPFPNSPVYSYGHRNPQGLAWQPGAGRLYATEHGPSGVPACCRDEVNLIEPGQNYGWPVIMGNQTREGMVAPIQQSGDTVTWAPGGAAFITRGPWAGSLVFTGLRGQALYRLTLDPNDPRKVQTFEELFKGQFGRLRDVVEGPDGALYITTSNRDGRGNPIADDDRVIRLTMTTSAAAPATPATLPQPGVSNTGAEVPGLDASITRNNWASFKTRPLGELLPDTMAYIATREGDMGVAVVVPSQRMVYSSNGDAPFHMASVAKVAIMLTVLDSASRSQRGLTTYQRTLLQSMIIYSGNDAADALWSQVGGARVVKAYLDSIGLDGIELDRFGAWGDSLASPEAVAFLFATLVEDDILDERNRDIAIDLMSRVDPSQRWGVTAGLPDELPAGWVVGVKNGWYPAETGWWVNSAGFFLPSNGKPGYTVAIMADAQPSLAYGIETIETIARQIHAKFGLSTHSN